jgi:hypothetical protein
MAKSGDGAVENCTRPTTKLSACSRVMEVCMSKFCQLTEIETDVVAWINPLLVRLVRPLPDGGTAT